MKMHIHQLKNHQIVHSSVIKVSFSDLIDPELEEEFRLQDTHHPENKENKEAQEEEDEGHKSILGDNLRSCQNQCSLW